MASVSNINTGGSYDIIQTVFTLSMLSNSANSVRHRSAEEIQKKLAADIEAGLKNDVTQIGSWTTVWGPVVFQNANSGVSDNAMYAAYNATAKCYVVAVAATNMHSTYDINNLDLNVSSMTAFPLGITPQYSTQPATTNVGNVSAGAALGITNLLNMQDPSTKQSLQTYLNSINDADAILIFTGHSLGGSLSPTLAAWLYPSIPASWSAIYVVPTAGPSTGDQGFCTNFSTVFPAYTIDGVNPAYGVFNQIIWNKFDCVPHAWTNIMNATPYEPENDIVWDAKIENGVVVRCNSIYHELTKINDTAAKVYAKIDSAYELAKGQDYIKSSNLMFIPPSLPPHIYSLDEFELQVGKQHTTEYSAFFGVSTGKGEEQIGVALLTLAPTSER